MLSKSRSQSFHSIGCDQVKFDSKILRTIGRLCPNLYALNLSQLHLTNEHLTTLSDYLNTKLNSLILIRCFDYERNTDSVLSQLLGNLPHLHSLDLSENDTLTGRCFFDVLDQHKRSTTNLCYNTMNNLSLNKCQNLKTKYLNCLGICYPNLEHFECSNQTKPLNECLIRLNQLIKLNLSFYKCDSSFLDDTCWKNLPNLKYIDLGHSSQINDQTLESLFRNFCSKNLEYLNISGRNERLNVRILENLANCQNLTELDLSWSEINDQLMIKSLTRMRKLRKLHLHACSFLSPNSLLRIVKANKNLKFVDVTCCHLINGAFLKCLNCYTR
uniref:Uncharacterized protein n=1 Tax=Romanomermis culicivorax TaxID=13658 RepID=A0A915IRN0_ROMCU